MTLHPYDPKRWLIWVCPSCARPCLVTRHQVNAQKKRCTTLCPGRVRR